MTPHIIATPRNRSQSSRLTRHHAARRARGAAGTPKSCHGDPGLRGEVR
jgi:hypothetical protein